MMRHATLPHRRQRGFSLIEVLVTMVVVALGLLGFAALQAHSIKSNRTALQRSYATMTAYDLIDCVRANRANAAAYEIGSIAGGVYTFTAPDDYTTDGSFTGNDLDAWLTRLGNVLPGGEAILDVNGSQVTVVIQWTENVNSNANVRFETQTSL